MHTPIKPFLNPMHLSERLISDLVYDVICDSSLALAAVGFNEGPHGETSECHMQTPGALLCKAARLKVIKQPCGSLFSWPSTIRRA